MLLETIMVPFFKLFGFFISLIPVINFTIPDGVFEFLPSLLKGVGYFIPLKGLLPILLFSISFHAFRFVWRILLRIKSFIPFIGG